MMEIVFRSAVTPDSESDSSSSSDSNGLGYGLPGVLDWIRFDPEDQADQDFLRAVLHVYVCGGTITASPDYSGPQTITRSASSGCTEDSSSSIQSDSGIPPE